MFRQVHNRRLLCVLPFLNEEGRVPSLSTDGRIPENVEYFFSTLMAVVTFTTVAACWVLFSRSVGGSSTRQGVVIGFSLAVVLSALDISLSAVTGRALSNWLFNLVPDYSPVLFVPIGVGMVLDRRLGVGGLE